MRDLFAALSLVALMLTANMARADVAEVNPRRASGGMAQEFKNHRLEPSAVPIPLRQATELSVGQRRVADLAEQVFQKNPALAMVIVDRGQIIYEAYRAPASATTAQFSWSMSKSLTAYTVGHLLCEGKIASLNDAAKRYAPELEGTVFGDASIRNLMAMSSGAVDGAYAGNAYKTATSDQWQDQRAGRVTGLEVLKQYGGRDIGSGQEFRYLANDTQSLAVVADRLGGFIEAFDRHIWKQIGAEASGYWLQDRDGAAIAAAGFSATARDWARLAMFSIKTQKSGSPCLQGFLREAHSMQLPNKKKRLGGAFDGYGYQVWTNPSFGNRRSYWWVGFGGQRVGVDAEQERIIVVSSFRESYMPDVYRVFAELQQMK
jgi:CubicO group peptidase (beta-lactamase class C family)